MRGAGSYRASDSQGDANKRPSGSAAAGVVAGIAATALAAALAEAHLGVSQAVCIVAVAISAALLVVALGWWGWLVGAVAGRLRRFARSQSELSQAEAAEQACRQAAARVRESLPQANRQGRVRRSMARRRALKRYGQNGRNVCRAALDRASAFVDVPVDMRELAEQPRSIEELYSLEGWLESTADRLRDKKRPDRASAQLRG